MDYEAFKASVREASERADSEGHPLSLPDLRRSLSTLLSRAEIDEYLLRLHREGRIHLLSQVDSALLSASEQADCLVHPSGLLLHWIRWLP